MRYRAFFSYARADDRIANWLHRELDGYRTPRPLVGSEGELGPVPAKLHPIFRDRTDLEAGGHVDAALQQALENSETLIVLCTPTSAKSYWVNHEVETFLKLGREAAIFPIIAAGEPESGKPETECFPPALRGGGLLAADLREIKKPNGQLVGDGREGGRLKLIAGLLGVPLDKLVQRERRRQRGVAMLFATAALVFAALAAFAGLQTILANNNAERARASEARAKDTLHRTFATQAWSRIDAGDHIEAARYALAGMKVSPQNTERFAGVLAVAMHRSHFNTPPMIHGSEVTSADFSPDGSRIFSVGDGGQAKVWDAADGRLLVTVKAAPGEFANGWFAPDGTRVLTAGGDGPPQLWRVDDGHLQTTFGNSKGALRTAQFSRDGRVVLTLEMDGGVGVWDAATGSRLRVFGTKADEAFEHSAIDGAEDAALSRAGDLVATTSKHKVQVWQVADGREIATIAGQAGAVPVSVSFSPDGAKLAITWLNESSGGFASLHTARSGQLLTSLAGVPAICWDAVFSPDSRFVVTMYNDSTAQLWNAQTGGLIARLGDSAEVGSGAMLDDGVSADFSPDSKRLVTSVYKNTAYLWSTEDGRLLESLSAHTAWIQHVAFSADGSRIVTASSDKAVRVWDDVGEGRRLDSFVGAQNGISSDGDRYLRYAETQIELRSIAPDHLLAAIPVPRDRIHRVLQTPDLSRMTIWPYDGEAAVWRMDGGAQIASLQDSSGAFLGSNVSKDGRLVAGMTAQGGARVWDADSGRILITLPDLTVGSMQFAGDNRFLVADEGQDLYVWDLKTRAQILALKGVLAKYADRRITPDGTAVLSVDKDGNVGLWRLADGERLLNFPPGHGDTRGLTFSTDGSRFITTGPWDATPRVWRTADGTADLAIAGLRMGAFVSLFSPDGRRIVIAGDRTVGFWSAIDGHNLAMFDEWSDADVQLGKDAKTALITDRSTGNSGGDTTTRFDVSRLTQQPEELARDACLFLLGPQERLFARATIDADPLLQGEWVDPERDVCEGIPGVAPLAEIRVGRGQKS